jgi:hypothetical protein
VRAWFHTRFVDKLMDETISQRTVRGSSSEGPRHALDVEPRHCLGTFSFRNKKSSRGEHLVKDEIKMPMAQPRIERGLFR